MPFHAKAAAISARHNRLSIFRNFLKGSACIALILAAASTTALAEGKYFKADGTKTDKLEEAAASWRTPEFMKNHALAGVKAEYAYAYGITGKGVKIGEVDSGVLASHPQLAGQFTSLTVEGTYGADGDRYESDEAGKWSWKKGDKFSVPGDYDPLFNDSHGTAAAGEMVGLRDGKEMHGIAFDAHLYSVNTGGTDSTLTGPSVDYEYFKEAYSIASRNGARVVNSSWGQTPASLGAYDTIAEMVRTYSYFSGKKTYLDAAAEASQQYGTIQVWANGNSGLNNPGSVATLPYFRPEIEKYWIGVTGVDKDGKSHYDRCGVAKYWCMAGPTVDIYSTSVGRNGNTYDRGHGAPSDKIRATYTPEYDGTSASAPNVTASLALVIQRFPYLDNSQARDVLFTTATHLTDARAVNDNADVPNMVFGWGRPNMESAMLGPKQFLDRFVVRMETGVNDVWSNDISQKALDAREMEEVKEVSDWLAKKNANGWENGISDKQLQDMVNPHLKTAPALLKTLAAVVSTGKYEKELLAMKANPLANIAFSRLLKKTMYPTYFPYAADPKYIGIARRIGMDLVKLLKNPNFSILPTDIDEFKAVTLGDYANSERRVSYLPTKTYDAGLTKLGNGQLTLTGDSTYSGDTIVNGGELVIGKEGSITSASVVNTNALFTVEGIAATTTVNKSGHLNVTETGATGDTSIVGGWAAINGKSGQTSVSEAGFLSGTGTLESLLAKSSGVVSPGNSVGVLNISKDATFEKGSLFEVEIKADQSLADRLAVGGTATLLGGAVNVRLEGKTALLSDTEIESFFNKHYAIVTAGTKVEGKFDAVNPAGNFNYIWTELDYSDNSKVVLGFDKKDVAWTIGANTHNQKAVSTAIQTTKEGNPLYNTVLFSTPDAPLVFDALSGEVHATLSGVLAKDSHFISDAATARVRNAFGGVAGKAQSVTAPLAYAEGRKAKMGEAFAALEPAPATTALWGEAYGSWAHADGDGNAAGYSRDIGGLVTGMDGVVADDWRFGLLAGYGRTSLHDNGKASVDSYQIGVYGGTKRDAFGLRLGANLGHHEIDTKRTARFGSLSNTHEASYNTNSIQVFGELGYEINTPYAALEPFAAVRYVHVKTDGFNEDGAISNLTGSGSSTDLIVTTLGLRASHQFHLSESTTLTARGLLGWNHGFGDVAPQAQLTFASGGDNFGVTGQPVVEDAAIVEAGFDIGIGKTTVIGLAYTGQFSSQAHDNAVKADLSVRF